MTTQTHKATLINLLIIMFSSAGFVATDLYLPSFPNMVNQYHSTTSMIQLSLSLFMVTFAISQFASGPLSDRFGRKPIAILGMIIFLVGSMLLFVKDELSWLYAGRMIQGLGIGSSVILSKAILADLFQGKKLAKTLSYLAIAVVFSLALAPAVGGYIQQHFNFTGNYVVMTAYVAILLVMTIFALPETHHTLANHATHPRFISRKLMLYFANPRFTANVLTSGLMLAFLIAYSTINPFIFEVAHGYSPSQYGDIVLVIMGGLVLGMITNGILINHTSMRQRVWIGLSIMIISLMGLLISTHFIASPLIALVICLCLANFGSCLVMPNVAATVYSLYPETKGLVSAVYGLIRITISAIVSTTILIIHINHIASMANLLLIIVGIAMACHYIANCRQTSANRHLPTAGARSKC